jgi:septum formation inhibitor MinC
MFFFTLSYVMLQLKKDKSEKLKETIVQVKAYSSAKLQEKGKVNQKSEKPLKNQHKKRKERRKQIRPRPPVRRKKQQHKSVWYEMPIRHPTHEIC